ncbi:hypothetical protein FNP_0148 [Fusobacterium polymorphum ATCC 10953]|uniref:Uncharacterized protein n=1 Tax=Fusobacterium polymorphum ATCC 10953 TaxID=393480 RepID=A5TSU2_FUSNP|nr:hypothetical protein FNP_0148 [Fusobacterium polymorphum ATCC 10953]
MYKRYPDLLGVKRVLGGYISLM